MPRQRHTEEQIIGILKESEAGAKTSELCRKHGISSPTFYKWKTKYAGMTVSDAKKLRQLEEENRKLNEQIALLGHVSDLQSTVDYLKEENTHGFGG